MKPFVAKVLRLHLTYFITNKTPRFFLHVIVPVAQLRLMLFLSECSNNIFLFLHVLSFFTITREKKKLQERVWIQPRLSCTAG